MENDFHAVALFSRDHPQAVGAAGVVVVPKLGMRVELLGPDLGIQASSAFWEFATTKLEGVKKEDLIKRAKKKAREECGQLNKAAHKKKE